MDRRDWELLDKQLQGSDPSQRNDGVPVLTVVSVFFAGMIHATAAMACDDNGTCRIRSHPPAGSTLVAL